MSRRLYRMATIAGLTGLSPALLRAWERRHGLLEPQRTGGGHRLYTDDDLRVLERVRDLLAQGRTIGEVAALGRPALLAPAKPGPVAPAPVAPAPTAPAPPAPPTAFEAATLDGARRAIVEAALSLDGLALERALDRAFGLVTPDAVIGSVIEPAAREIGELWARGRLSVAGEHLASTSFMRRVLKLVETGGGAPHAAQPVAIVACFPDEQHQVGALVVAYALTRRGFRVVFLGAALPLEDLEGACAAVRPELLLLSVTREALLRAHTPRLLELLRRKAPELEVHVGGAGVVGDHPDLERAGVRLWPAGGGFDDLWRGLPGPQPRARPA